MIQRLYTRKSDINPIIEEAISTYQCKGVDHYTNFMHERILVHKVKFPLLEYIASTMTKIMSFKDQLLWIDTMVLRKTEGGNVIIGILLQFHLHKNYTFAFEKAKTVIADGDAWYVADLIGERVFGVGLLVDFDAGYSLFHTFGQRGNFWVKRALGAGAHYAIKKNLEGEKVEQIFRWLLGMTEDKNYQVKQGIGWAAKTTAKFHPNIITKYKAMIDASKTPQWFQKKIEIGLNRHAYASRKRG